MKPSVWCWQRGTRCSPATLGHSSLGLSGSMAEPALPGCLGTRTDQLWRALLPVTCKGMGELSREKSNLSCGRGVTISPAPLGRRVPHPVCHWESLGAEMWQLSHSCLKPRPRPGCHGDDMKGMCCSLPWPLSLVMAFLSCRDVLRTKTGKPLEGGCPCSAVSSQDPYPCRTPAMCVTVANATVQLLRSASCSMR